MEPHDPYFADEFLSDEFFRYSAECRRLARLARRSSREAGHASFQTLIERLGEMRRHIVQRSGHQTAYRLVPRTVRSSR
jgi:hypothetical protein